MLQAMRDHEETLSQTERFYYNNYEYYNDYEDLTATYRNDLSKLRFNLHRKSRAHIVLYDTISSNYSDLPHERLIGDYAPRHSHHDYLINKDLDRDLDFKTLDDLLYKFTQTYHEHNYSDIKLDREDAKDQLEVSILKFLEVALRPQFENSEEQDYKDLSDILQRLKEKGEEVVQYLQLLFEREGRVESGEFLQRWHAFEHYWRFLLETKLQADNKNEKIENFYLFEFCLYFRYLLAEIASCNSRNILLLAQPFTPSLSAVVHPLVIPLTFSLKSNPSPPRVLFLNLDGRETYYNLRAVGCLPESVRYISIFRQPTGEELTSFKLQKGCSQFQFDVEYVNVAQAHSELLFRQVRPRNLEGALLPPNDNVILYPLNSLHLRRSYSMYKLNEGFNNIEDRRLPLLESEDIYWLWRQMIAAQVEQWAPELVIVSYNGELDLKEQDFRSILKDLTVLADHRVVLFTNMTGMFQTAAEGMQEQMGEEWSVEKIEMVQQFVDKYVPYSYGKVDEERYFNNLSSFIKISSGAHSLQSNTYSNPLSRYSLGRRLQYVQRLAELPEFEDLLPLGSSGSSLNRLFNKFAVRQLLQNRKENELWQKRIEDVEKELLQLNVESLLQQEDIGSEKRRKERETAFRIQAIKQELEVEELLVHGSGMDLEVEFREYLRRGKERLLLSNLESYRYRKAYVPEEDERGARIRCLRLCLNEEQIRLERYSQVIMNEKKSQVFVINYRMGDEGHVMLSGEVQEKDGSLRMSKVNAKLQESMGYLILDNRIEVVHLNYSYCFLKEKLYLFWPQEWDTREEIRRRLLALQYSPPHVNYMVRLQFSQQEKVYIVEQLKFKIDGGLPAVPRRGCACLEAADNRFYIFGGIYDSRLDFYTSGSGVSSATIEGDSFRIEAPQKKKQRYLTKINCIKPKMNYRIERTARSSEQGGSVLLSGGYGRLFTNFHSLFSYETYSASAEMEGLKITKLEIKNCRLVRLQKPMAVPVIGRYLVGGYGEAEERFTEQVKDWVLAQGSKEDANGDRVVLSVVEDELRVREFKSNYRRQYLFGWDRTIRERIYLPHCWSPELQIVTGQRLYLVNTALKTDKSSHYNTAPFLIPREEDLVSMCLEEDKLLLLSSSMLCSMDNPSSLSNLSSYSLYQGSLESIGDLFTRRELPMLERYEWKSSKGLNLQETIVFKTIFALDDKIYLLGGLGKAPFPPGFRDEFVLQRAKDKLKLRIRRLQCVQDCLSLASPVVVKHKDGFLLYSIVVEKKQVGKGASQLIEDSWRLKIETFTPNESAQQEKLRVGPLLLYHYDYQSGTLQRRKAAFEEPKIVKILPYSLFSFSLLRELLQKVYVKISHREDEKLRLYSQFIFELLAQRDEARLSQLLRLHHHRGTVFKQLLGQFDVLLDEQKRERDNVQNQELVRDLRNLYSLLNKHLFESILQPEADANLYRFLFEDRSSRKVKYMAIGRLLTTRLQFLRIRYKHELSVCLNEGNEQELFLNTSVMCCEQIVRERVSAGMELQEEEQEARKVLVTYAA